MAVKVQRVRGAQAGLDDPVDPLVGVGQLVHVLLGGPRVVVLVDLQQRGVVPLVDEGGVAHGPVEAARGGGHGDGEVGRDVGQVGGVDLDVGHQVCLVDALVDCRVVICLGGGVCRGRAIVADDALDVAWVVVVGAGCLSNGAQPVVVRCGVGSHDDVVPLANGNVHDIGSVRVDRNEVAGDDFHGVVVNGEFEMSVGSHVDQADAVSSSSSEDCLVAGSDNSAVFLGEGVGAVDESGVHGWGTADSRNKSQVIRGVVRPVSQDHGSKVNIIVGCRRAVDDDAAKDAIPGLDVEVRVPPRGAVLGSSPSVRGRLSRRRRALGDGSNAIVLVCVVLANTVEVDGGTVVLHGVGHMHNNSVTPITKVEEQVSNCIQGRGCGSDFLRNDGWARNCSVDRQDYPLHSIRSSGSVDNVEPVFSGNAGVRDLVVVVGGDIKIPPAVTRIRRVHTSLRQRW